MTKKPENRSGTGLKAKSGIGEDDSRSLRITLVSPPNIEFRDAGKAHLVEPLGLAYIAAVLEKEGYPVRIIDADTLEYSISETISKVLASRPDVVGFSCQTPMYPIGLKIAKAIKRADGRITTIFGGIHATSFPQIVKEPDIDYAVVGEGEYPFLNIVKSLESGKDCQGIAGVCFYDGKMHMTPPQRILDLDALPFPARHLLPMKKYHYSFPVPLKHKKLVYASVNLSRGCPYGCVFCNSPRQWNRRVVFRSADNILAEFKELKKKYGVNTFYIRDEVFTLNKPNVIKLCKMMIRERLDFNWFCYGRADHLDKEILTWMKRAGCKLVKIGVETGDPKIMELIKKGETLEQIEHAFRIAHKVGMYTHASFMIGHPWDSRLSVERTIRFAQKLNADTVAFPIMTPFPGTEVWDIAKKENLFITDDFERFNVVGSSVMRTKYLKPETLVKLQKQALRRYYFRLGYIKRALGWIVKNPRAIKMYVKPAWLLLKWLRS